MLTAVAVVLPPLLSFGEMVLLHWICLVQAYFLQHKGRIMQLAVDFSQLLRYQRRVRCVPEGEARNRMGCSGGHVVLQDTQIHVQTTHTHPSTHTHPKLSFLVSVLPASHSGETWW
jgi:hypothetical protein